jgi:transcriptional regulator with XRE-family HTH domain
MTQGQIFGEYLRFIRERVFEESLRAFAARVDLSPGYIGKLELGQIGVPRRPTIEAMAEKLELDPDALLLKAGYLPENPSEEDEYEFISIKLSRIAPDVREVVLTAFSAELDALAAKYPAPRPAKQ